MIVFGDSEIRKAPRWFYWVLAGVLAVLTAGIWIVVVEVIRLRGIL